MWKINISELNKRGIKKVGPSGYLVYGEKSINEVTLVYTFDLIRRKILFSLEGSVVAYIYTLGESPKLVNLASMSMDMDVLTEINDMLSCFAELLTEDFETDYSYSNDIALKFRYKMLSKVATGEINPLELETILDRSEQMVNYCNIRHGYGTEYIIRSGQGVEVCNTDIIIPWERVKAAFIKMVQNFTDIKNTYPMDFKYLRSIPSFDKGLITAAFYTLLNEEFSTRTTLEEIFEKPYTEKELSEYLKSNWPIGNYLYNKATGTVDFNTDINTNSYIGKNRCHLRDKNYNNKIICQPVYDPYSSHTKIVSLFTCSHEGISICSANGEVVHSYGWDEIAHVLYANDLWRTDRRLLEVISLNEEEVIESDFEEPLMSDAIETSDKEGAVESIEDYVENYMELFTVSDCVDNSEEGYLDKSDSGEVDDYVPNYMDLFTNDTPAAHEPSTAANETVEEVINSKSENYVSDLFSLAEEEQIEEPDIFAPDYSVANGGQLSLF